jgi:RNA polymerase sigma-70 factor (ECF subfamily)
MTAGIHRDSPDPFMAASSDNPLLDRIKANDPAAAEEMVRTHLPPLLATARRMLRHEDDARDAVQEGFLAAFRGIGEFDGRSSLATWLHRIVVNACLMKLRTRKRKPERSIEELLPRFTDDEHHSPPPSAWRSPSLDALVRKELSRRVLAAIDELPDNYRTVLLLRDIEGLDTAETARILDATPAVVKTRLHRARQALRELLDPEMRSDPC